MWLLRKKQTNLFPNLGPTKMKCELWVKIVTTVQVLLNDDLTAQEISYEKDGESWFDFSTSNYDLF